MSNDHEEHRVPREACLTMREAMAEYAKSRNTLAKHLGKELSVVMFPGDKRHYLIRDELVRLFHSGQVIKPALLIVSTSLSQSSSSGDER